MSAADIASQNLYLEKCKPPIQKQLAKQLRLDTIKWAYFTSIGRIFVTKGHIVGFYLAWLSIYHAHKNLIICISVSCRVCLIDLCIEGAKGCVHFPHALRLHCYGPVNARCCCKPLGGRQAWHWHAMLLAVGLEATLLLTLLDSWGRKLATLLACILEHQFSAPQAFQLLLRSVIAILPLSWKCSPPCQPSCVKLHRISNIQQQKDLQAIFWMHCVLKGMLVSATGRESFIDFPEAVCIGSSSPSESVLVKVGTLRERVLALKVSIEGTSEDFCSSWGGEILPADSKACQEVGALNKSKIKIRVKWTRVSSNFISHSL